MKNLASLSRIAALLTLTLACIGCGQGSHSDIGVVSGTVTLDGQPYPNAQVVFTPQEGRPSTGITDAAGKYELIYVKAEKGASIGEHSVAITTIPPETTDRDPGPPFVETIPNNFNTNTTLTAQVEAGENSHDFAITTK